jgi:hypothetical protein|tara:strand:- start:2664 stop:2816 length:153 start_codon:yes stop_codon:yes gene_type:complete
MKITKTRLATNEAKDSFLLLWFVGTRLKSKIFTSKREALDYQSMLLGFNV